MNFKMMDLPFPVDALAPHISADTVEVHYGKHHTGYLKKLEKEIGGSSLADSPLVDIIRDSTGDVFNWASQVWNHDFYWKSIDPKGGGDPPKSIRKRLESAFGTVDSFRSEFSKAAVGEFGSGWAWLVADASGKLSIVSSSDAESPLQTRSIPLLTIDVWEHAYYLDYKNERKKYVDNFIAHLINWDFAARNLEGLG